MGGLEGPHYEPTGTERAATRSMLEGQLKASARELAGSGVGKDKDKKAPPARAPEGDSSDKTQERAPATPQEAAVQTGEVKAEGKKMAGGALSKLDRFIQKLPSASVGDNLTLTGEYNPDGSKKITGSSSIDFSGTRLSLGASGSEVAGEQNYALSTQAATKLGTFGLSLGNTAGDLSSSLRASMRTFAGGNLTANINLLDLGQSQVAIEQPLGRFNAKVSMAQAEGGAGAIYTAGVGGELVAGVQANLSASTGPKGDISGTAGISGHF